MALAEHLHKTLAEIMDLSTDEIKLWAAHFEVKNGETK
jgi:hypothetical protein